MTEAIRILFPGAHTSVQDLGRFGAYAMGVPASGSLDDYAHRVANWLVGNPPDRAVLEMAVIGIKCEMGCEADIAVTGAAMDLKVNGRPRRLWESIRVKPGDILQLGMAEAGCRAYLAITGGINVPLVMGSRSTYLAGRMGGFKGRVLEAGDLLARGPGRLLETKRRLPWRPLYPETIRVRAVPGPHDAWFTGGLERFFASTFTVSPQSNRMGYRFTGPAIQRDPDAPQSILSEPVAPGNVQVPPDGLPIVLLKEQTIGGYTSIATVISPDLFRLGQAGPGVAVRFIRVSLDEAHAILKAWTRFLEEIPSRIERVA